MAVTRRAVLKTMVAAGVGAVSGAGSYGYLYGRHELATTRATLSIARLPASLEGLRLGLLTDVHRGRFVPHEDVARAVAALMHENPDLIVLGGDYVTWGNREFIGPSADALAPLAAPHGVFGILGNHDDDHAMPAALARNGVQMLKDARTRITIRGAEIDLIGIRFWTRRGHDIAAPRVLNRDLESQFLTKVPQQLGLGQSAYLGDLQIHAACTTVANRTQKGRHVIDHLVVHHW